MENMACAQCGVEIESRGIHFKGRHFCDDDCCEEFDAALAAKSEPKIDDLNPGLDLEEDTDLGYQDKDSLDEDDALLDDDFDIREQDF